MNRTRCSCVGLCSRRDMIDGRDPEAFIAQCVRFLEGAAKKQVEQVLAARQLSSRIGFLDSGQSQRPLL